MKPKTTPLDAFLARKAEIDSALKRLQSHSDDFFALHPDHIHWGHVGKLAYYAERLRQLTDSVFKKGE